MSFSPDIVHQYQRIPGTEEVRLMRSNPYIRFKEADAPPLFISGGYFWGEGDSKPFRDRDVPMSVVVAAARCSDQVLRESGCSDDRIEEIRRASRHGEFITSKVPGTIRLKTRKRND